MTYHLTSVSRAPIKKKKKKNKNKQKKTPPPQKVMCGKYIKNV